MHAACASADKQFHRISGANHYFKGQPGQMREAVELINGWAQARGW
jgi:hypothetical protein